MAPSTYAKSNCTSFADSACVPWTTCLSTAFQTNIPTAYVNRACTNCTICPVGKFTTTVCLSTSDTNCTTCSKGYYSPSINRTECLPWRDCPAGKYISVNGTVSIDNTCSNCTSQQYQDLPSQYKCYFRLNCSAGAQELTPPTATSNRVCVNCTLGGTWKNTSGQLTGCLNLTTCNPGAFQSNTFSTSLDRVCTSCANATFQPNTNQLSCLAMTPCLLNVSFQSAPDTKTTDRTCSPLTVCIATQWQSNTITLTADRMVNMFLLLLLFIIIILLFSGRLL